MYIKIALRNARRQMGNYLIYFLTVMLTVALMFSVNNLIYSENLKHYTDMMESMKNFLLGLSVVIALVVALILGYVTSFMVKLRKREFGTYLTLGMKRKNILAIFLIETAVMGLAAILIGMVLGLFLYQGMMMLMSKLMDMEFAFAAYSKQGLVLTVVLVILIFFFASVASAVYLSRVSIHELIHPDTKRETGKPVRHPVAWVAAASVALVGMIVSCVLFGEGLQRMNESEPASGKYLTAAMFLLTAGIMVFHIGISQGLMGLLMKRRKFCSRGGNTFLLRQLSEMLHANAAMMASIAFLIVFAVIGANYAYVMKYLEQKMLDEVYRFDVEASVPAEGAEGPSLAEGMKKIEEYQPISKAQTFDLYTNEKNEIFGNLVREAYGTEKDTFMKESDYNKLAAWKGAEPVTCGTSYYVAENSEFLKASLFTEKVLEENGKRYAFAGLIQNPNLPTAVIVVPDDAAAGMKTDKMCALADLEEGRYDVQALYEELSYETAIRLEQGETANMVWNDFHFKEKARQERNSVTAILTAGALYLAVVFVFMSMAVLALKMFAGLESDRRRYHILNCLGAGREEQKRILFRQIFVFFFVPFGVPILFGIPTAALCAKLTRLVGYAELTGRVCQNAGWIAMMLLVVYTLYFMATYMIAKRNTLTL